MNTRIVFAVIAVVLLYGIYSFFTTRNYDAFDVNSQQYEESEVAHPLPASSPDRVVAPGGPNAPATKPPASNATIVPPETPYDPMAQNHESSEIPERLRHPERVYSPGLVNDGTEQATASGIASMAQQQTAHNYQTFGPEFVSNGGAFMEENGVMANDSMVDLSYSML
jgi:hypothetical protein